MLRCAVAISRAKTRQSYGARTLLLVTWVTTGFAGSTTAHAFSDPRSSYDLPVLDGGGGGRWFTGTSKDGFGCDVCHTNRAAVPLAITGLPLDAGYAPGQPYEVGVRWPEQVEHLALVLEMVDDSGGTAGSLAVPVPEAARSEEQCSEEGAEGIPASSVIDSASGRQLAAVVDCGSRAMRMLWTAPSPVIGTVWLSGGFVWSDDDASAAGDISVPIRKPIPALGAQAPEQVLAQAGCSAGRPHASASWQPLAASLGLLYWARRRRSEGRSR